MSIREVVKVWKQDEAKFSSVVARAKVDLLGFSLDWNGRTHIGKLMLQQ